MQGTDIGWVLWLVVGVYVVLGVVALVIEWRRVKR